MLIAPFPVWLWALDYFHATHFAYWGLPVTIFSMSALWYFVAALRDESSRWNIEDTAFYGVLGIPCAVVAIYLESGIAPPQYWVYAKWVIAVGEGLCFLAIILTAMFNNRPWFDNRACTEMRRWAIRLKSVFAPSEK
jgi:hypothetical protein